MIDRASTSCIVHNISQFRGDFALYGANNILDQQLALSVCHDQRYVRKCEVDFLYCKHIHLHMNIFSLFTKWNYLDVTIQAITNGNKEPLEISPPA